MYRYSERAARNYGIFHVNVGNNGYEIDV